MDKKKEEKSFAYEKKVAATVNEEDSFGEDATKEEIERGESTKVTRLVADEYDPS